MTNTQPATLKQEIEGVEMQAEAKQKLRRYFECPIQALYMMKEFGVEVAHPKHIGDNESYKSYPSASMALSDLEYFLLKGGKIYVSPQSESIFEPKEGDLVDGLFGKGDDKNDSQQDIDILRVDSIYKPIRLINKIIMRDNKQFFQES